MDLILLGKQTSDQNTITLAEVSAFGLLVKLAMSHQPYAVIYLFFFFNGLNVFPG